jgi:hypothetical protein
MTVSVPVGCRVWVLLEGASDVAAVRVVAERAGIDLAAGAVHLTDMRGATNIRSHVLAATQAAKSPRLLGMCDAPEALLPPSAAPRRLRPRGRRRPAGLGLPGLPP